MSMFIIFFLFTKICSKLYMFHSAGTKNKDRASLKKFHHQLFHVFEFQTTDFPPCLYGEIVFYIDFAHLREESTNRMNSYKKNAGKYELWALPSSRG